ncbi:hypothetical protein EWB00_001196 [Schistosoma japonicum]|uniref:Uncharacterized protein n=1 Tax=Schistosoma japonicum TaxID=6182 RepID=A0A4Z2CK87_SCHJA|nr:hypothetical protein EWB00_001196 [Schistosoma japonicum]
MVCLVPSTQWCQCGQEQCVLTFAVHVRSHSGCHSTATRRLPSGAASPLTPGGLELMAANCPRPLGSAGHQFSVSTDQSQRHSVKITSTSWSLCTQKIPLPTPVLENKDPNEMLQALKGNFNYSTTLSTCSYPRMLSGPADPLLLLHSFPTVVLRDAQD